MKEIEKTGARTFQAEETASAKAEAAHVVGLRSREEAVWQEGGEAGERGGGKVQRDGSQRAWEGFGASGSMGIYCRFVAWRGIH